MKVNGVVRVSTSLDIDFFRKWFVFLKPYHGLTNRTIDVIATFVKERYRLSKCISDPKILDQVTMSDNTKKIVREECNMKLQHFQVEMGKLRKAGVIEDDKINPRFIPCIDDESGEFNLLLKFVYKK